MKNGHYFYHAHHGALLSIKGILWRLEYDNLSAGLLCACYTNTQISISVDITQSTINLDQKKNTQILSYDSAEINEVRGTPLLLPESQGLPLYPRVRPRSFFPSPFSSHKHGLIEKKEAESDVNPIALDETQKYSSEPSPDSQPFTPNSSVDSQALVSPIAPKSPSST